ncbi:hypothetical protein [Schaalia vaccimaxillae]|uniref:hypothetical protein n=1 Tax=Schaalia vaccimaxillae TaxID=183916 RepID=UPI0003B681EF|nr:hypothetical protein [Schaalia vaccimaxillae]
MSTTLPLHNRNAAISMAAGVSTFLTNTAGGRFRVVVGFDSGSESLALDAAAVIEGAGGHTILMPRPLPTPIIAFTVRMLLADAAVMICAGPSPSIGHECTVFFGGRVADPISEGVRVAGVNETELLSAIETAASAQTVQLAESGWEQVGEGMIGAYIDRIISNHGAKDRSLKIAYAPTTDSVDGLLSGVLERAGFNVLQVEAHADINAALQAVGTDEAGLVLVTDPHGERLWAAIPNSSTPGRWHRLSSDEVARILGDRIARARAMDEDAVLVSTTDCSDVLDDVAKIHQVSSTRTEAGMKNIARTRGMVFGYDGEHGYCTDPAFVRDSDGISAAVMLAATFDDARRENRSLEGCSSTQRFA